MTESFHIIPPSIKPEAIKKVAGRSHFFRIGSAKVWLLAYPSSKVITTLLGGSCPFCNSSTACFKGITLKCFDNIEHCQSSSACVEESTYGSFSKVMR